AAGRAPRERALVELDQTLPAVVLDERSDALELATHLAPRRILAERAREGVERRHRGAEAGRLQLADAHEQPDAPLRLALVLELDLVHVHEIGPGLELLVDRLEDAGGDELMLLLGEPLLQRDPR